MSQLNLGLLNEIYDTQSPSVSPPLGEPVVTEDLKARIVDALRLEQLPPQVFGGETSIDPSGYDLGFLSSVVNRHDVAHYRSSVRISMRTLVAAVRDLVDEGRVIESRYYYGSDQPGLPGYRGFKPVFRLANEGSV